jgi:predicted esterase
MAIPPEPDQPVSRSREAHIRVPRTARYHVLGDPATSAELWVVIHGYQQLAERFIRRFEALPGVGRSRAVLAPEALSRFYVEQAPGAHGPESRVGASWMTRADRQHEIEDYVEYLDRLAAFILDGPNARRRLVVLGFSQGAETASRWATYGRTRPDELILWGGGLAADLDPGRATDTLRAVALRLVVGSQDGWARERAAESERRLAAMGLACERIAYTGGHTIDAATLARRWPG